MANRKKELEAAVKAAKQVLAERKAAEDALEAELLALNKQAKATSDRLDDARSYRHQAEDALDDAQTVFDRTKPLSPTSLAFLEAASKTGGFVYWARRYQSRHDSRSTKEGNTAQAMARLGFVDIDSIGATWTTRQERATATDAGRAKLAEELAKNGKVK